MSRRECPVHEGYEVRPDGSCIVCASIEEDEGGVPQVTHYDKEQHDATAKAPGPQERMNKTETRRYYELRILEDAGEIVRGSILYEELKFRLADRTWYTPDFLYLLPSGRAVIEEIKGWKGELQHREDGWVKYKTCAEKFGWLFEFRLLIALPKKAGGGWETRVSS